MMAQRQPVVFVVFQSGRRSNGGVESITQVIESFTQVRPIVLTQLETPVNDRWRQAGAEVRVQTLAQRADASLASASWRAKIERIGGFVRFNTFVARVVREAGAQVVHFNDPHALWHGIRGAKRAGAHTVYNVRDTRSAEEMPQRLWKWKLAFRLTDVQLVLSQEMRAFWGRLIYADADAAPLRYIYSIVDTDRMRPRPAEERERLRAERGIAPDEQAVGYVGTFNAKKAQLPFIEHVVQRLAERCPAARVHFLGDFDPVANSYAAACRDAVERLGLADVVRFAGHAEDVAEWYGALDVLALASQKEGMARCMIEGIASGLPMVSFDVATAREILEAYDLGKVAEQGDYAAFTEHLVALVRDSALGARARIEGPRVATALFDRANAVRAYEALYAELSETTGRAQ